jgi:hypothetical protein
MKRLAIVCALALVALPDAQAGLKRAMSAEEFLAEVQAPEEKPIPLFTRSVWVDSDGVPHVYKFGALNSPKSWDALKGGGVLMTCQVNQLYIDSTKAVWRYVGGALNKAESWKRVR